MKTNAIKEGTVEGAVQGRKTHQLIKLGVEAHSRDRLKMAV